jgi:hypothetical protein
MKVFHIIEETADQQVVEIITHSLSDAIMLYMQRATHEQYDNIDVVSVGQIRYNYPTEYCIITAQTDRVVFARWVHKRGLY